MTALLSQWLVTGTAVAALAMLVVTLMPAGAAAQRHLLWWGALIAVLLLPLLPALAPVPAFASGEVVAASPIPSSLLSLATPAPWVTRAAMAVWLLWVSVSGLRLAHAALTIRRLALTAMPLETALAESFRQVRTVRGARVCVSPAVRGACAIGFVNPRIVVSSRLASRLPSDMLESIVLHEAAHLERYDDWTRLAERLILAMAGLHPAVYWICRQMDLECEAACDQRVVGRTRAPLAYARSLAAAAQIASRQSGLHTVLAPGASVTGGGLHQRVCRLLDAAPVRARTRVAGSLAGLCAVGAAACAAVAVPPVITFTDLARPLALLASLPVAPGILAPVRDSAGLTDQTAGESTRARMSIPNVRARAAEPSEPDALAPAIAAVPFAETAQLAAVQTDTLRPRPLAPLLVEFAAAPADVPSTNRIGTSAARAGVAAATAAAAAGHSVSRFFRSGSRAVSDAL